MSAQEPSGGGSPGHVAADGHGLVDLLVASSEQRRPGLACTIEAVRDLSPELGAEMLAVVMHPGISRNTKAALLRDVGLPMGDSAIAHHIAGHCASCRTS